MSKTLEDNIINFLDDICTNTSNVVDQSFSSILDLCTIDILQKTDEFGNTFFMKACAHQPQAVKNLIESGKMTHQDFIRKNSQGLNAICIACISQPDALKIMLEKVPRIDEYLRFGCTNNWTPVMYASYYNSTSLFDILQMPICSTKYLKMTGTDGHNVITLGCLNSDTNSLKYLINEPKCTVELFEESCYENKNVLMLLMSKNPDYSIIETFFNSPKCSQHIVQTMMDDGTSTLSIGCTINIDIVKLMLDSDKCTQEFVRSHDWSKVEFIDDDVMEFVFSHEKYEKIDLESTNCTNSTDDVEVEEIEEVEASVIGVEIQHAKIITIDDAKTVPNDQITEWQIEMAKLTVEECEIKLKIAQLALKIKLAEVEQMKYRG